MEMFSLPVGSLVPSILIINQEFLISCLISSATTELIAEIILFCISKLVYVAFYGIVLMIARLR